MSAVFKTLLQSRKKLNYTVQSHLLGPNHNFTLKKQQEPHSKLSAVIGSQVPGTIVGEAESFSLPFVIHTALSF